MKKLLLTLALLGSTSFADIVTGVEYSCFTKDSNDSLTIYGFEGGQMLKIEKKILFWHDELQGYAITNDSGKFIGSIHFNVSKNIMLSKLPTGNSKFICKEK